MRGLAFVVLLLQFGITRGEDSVKIGGDTVKTSGLRIIADGVTVVDTAASPITHARLSIKLPDLPASNKALLLSSLNEGHTVSVVGTSMYFTGFGVGIASLIANANSPSRGMRSVMITSSIVQLAGPIVSCIGGDISSKAMNLYYEGYGWHRGWHYYGNSWGLFLADVGVAFAGSFLAAGAGGNNPTGGDLIAVATIGAVVIIGVCADIDVIKAVISPLNYSSTAIKMVE